MKKFFFYFLWSFPNFLLSQGACDNTFIKIFGSPIENDKGYSLAASLDQQSVYLGGIKNDSAVILKIRTSGEVEWTRTFDIVKNKPDHIYRILVDSEGMIAVSGIAGSQTAGGTVFVFRYDPETNKILWAKEYISNSTNFNLGMIEIGPGGDYLVTDNPTAPNNAELMKIDRNTGGIIQQFSKHFNLGSSESVYDIVYYNGMLYGSGRFSDGGTTDEMRTTLLKMSPDDGTPAWVKLGYKLANSPQRLYGLDLIIASDNVYSIFVGDPSGSDLDHSKIYVLKSDLDGNLDWIKQYELPGTNDWADEMIQSNGGLVILGRNRFEPSDLILFKIDYDGKLIWAKQYDYAYNDNAVSLGSIQSQLIEADSHYYFTGFAEENGNSDMILVRTDLEGKISDTCSVTTSISMQVNNVINPVLYKIDPDVFDFVPMQNTLTVNPGHSSNFQLKNICKEATALENTVEVSICEGDTFEGYSQEGQYIDHFITAGGCDSSRILQLHVLHEILTYVEMEICFGEFFEGYDAEGTYVDTFISIHGCDSSRILQLHVLHEILTSVDIEICFGEFFEGYGAEGTYIDTFISIHGCDSIRFLHLTQSFQTFDQHVEICSGGNFEMYTLPGIYIDTLKGFSIPCDTIRHLTLSVLPLIQNTISRTICEGEDYFGYTQDGLYTDTLKTALGCDSIRTVSLEIAHDKFTVITASFCEGGKHGHQQPGMYTDTLVSADGCDSIRTLQLEGAAHYLPNVFSPNGDGLNDFFTVVQFPENSFSLDYFAIFDRFGNMAYESNGMPIQWNGENKDGEFYNPGVFTYILVYTCGEEKITETGDITMIR